MSQYRIPEYSSNRTIISFFQKLNVIRFECCMAGIYPRDRSKVALFKNYLPATLFFCRQHSRDRNSPCRSGIKYVPRDERYSFCFSTGIRHHGRIIFRLIRQFCPTDHSGRSFPHIFKCGEYGFDTP